MAENNHLELEEYEINEFKAFISYILQLLDEMLVDDV